MLTMIAITTKNLIADRVVVGFKPFVESCAMMKKVVRLPELVSVIIDMIESKKKSFSLTTTGAFVTTVSHNSGILKPIVIGKGILSVLVAVFNVPFSRSCNVIFSGVSLSVIPQPLLRPVSPLSSVFNATLFTLKSVKVRIFSSIAALFTSFHGVTSIIKSIFDYVKCVNKKAQRLSRNGVGASAPKRLASRTDEDIVWTARKLAAVA